MTETDGANEPPLKVLYVDDEPVNLRVFLANFQGRFSIVTALSGEEALRLLTESADGFAVLITDQRMPGMSGVELLERAKVLDPAMQRMMLTAYSDTAVAVDAVNRGQVSRYFVKPWRREEVQVAIDDALRIVRLGRQLRTLEERMNKQERLAAIGQVSAGIAHELLNPVSYMSQNSQLLRADVDELRGLLDRSRVGERAVQILDELPQMLADLEMGVKHIRQIAMGMRAQARGDDDEHTAQVDDVVGFAVKLAKAKVRPRAIITASGPSASVALGPVKLCQVLLNLLLNASHAVDALPPPSHDGFRVPRIDVTWAIEDGHLRLEVGDNGRGIPNAAIPRVFDPLFTTRGHAGGTGLGLSICKEIVEQAGGRISLTSKENEGTTVSLSLGLSRDA